jgi:hypothetical protein
MPLLCPSALELGEQESSFTLLDHTAAGTGLDDRLYLLSRAQASQTAPVRSAEG